VSPESVNSFESLVLTYQKIRIHNTHGQNNIYTISTIYDAVECSAFYRQETAYNASLLDSHVTQNDVVFLIDWFEDFMLQRLYNNKEMIENGE
jgi:hypothetical protein